MSIRIGSKFQSEAIATTCPICKVRVYKENVANVVARYSIGRDCCNNEVCKKIMKHKEYDLTVYKKNCERCGRTTNSKLCDPNCKRESKTSNVMKNLCNL